MGRPKFFGNETIVPPVNWQPEPNVRGTWSIISSCLLTLSLCLWTALHLNIPEHNGNQYQRVRKFGWLLIGLLAPEMVACMALIQRRSALRITRALRAKFGEKPELRWKWLRSSWRLNEKVLSTASDPEETKDSQSRVPARHHPWSHVHSFYAIMGGFAFDTNNAKVKFLPNGLSRLTLHPKALIYLADHAPHLIPDLSVQDIRDKSKADGLAKLIVCFQALWFCVQCIVRVAQGQAISFLELNTFAHALCALLIYALWWHKPLDIDSPTLLEGDEAWELCALMCVNSSDENSWIGPFPVIGRDLNRRLYLTGPSLTEMSHGQKYGERATANLADYFDGRYSARIRQQFTSTRMILRWDPTSIALEELKASTNVAWASLQNSEANLPNDKTYLIRKGRPLFGFRCMDVLQKQISFVRMTCGVRTTPRTSLLLLVTLGGPLLGSSHPALPVST